MRVTPIGVSEVPESSISETLFYVGGNMMSIKDSNLRVIPERTVYKK